jgi:uridine phosphorylase
MQTAALFTAGTKLGIALAAVLVVTDAEGSDTLGDEILVKQAEAASQAALRALL